jgi:hypothetical protein
MCVSAKKSGSTQSSRSATLPSANRRSGGFWYGGVSTIDPVAV